MRLIRRFIAGSLILVLSACASMGNIKPQSHLLDPNKLGAGKAIENSAAAAEWPKQQWWQDLHDPQLNKLVSSALADNPSLHVSQARVRQARAIGGIAEENTRPKAEASLSLDRELYSEHGTAPASLAGKYAWRNQATLSGSYDLDLWGRNRQALAAALDDIQLASAESQMVRLALETAIVRSYIQLSLAFELQDIIKSSLVQRERILDITRHRKQVGLATEIDVVQIETTLPASRRELEQVAESIALLRNELAALTGKGPADGETITRPTLKLDSTFSLPSTLPADLIGRRPDIAAQRWRVEAAAKRIDVAKADFYPNINLVAFAGFQAFGFSNFLNADSAVRGIAPAISLPIFSGGQLRAQLGNQTALYDGAVEQYNATVIQALSDVAGAITRVQSLKQQNILTEGSIVAAKKANDLANQVFRAGMTDSINVLNTQVALLYEKQQMAQIGAREIDGYITLMIALGGGI